MLDIVLVAALLAGPKDIDSSWIEVLRPTIITLAVNSELTDPRECTHLFTQNPIEDFAMLRSRNVEFVSYPQLWECNRFPQRDLITKLLSVNRLYRNDLTTRLTVDSIHEDVIRDAIVEIDQLYYVWDVLRDAQCDYYNITVRRQALESLRTLIGAESFYLGQMPLHIPVWHLPRN